MVLDEIIQSQDRPIQHLSDAEKCKSKSNVRCRPLSSLTRFAVSGGRDDDVERERSHSYRSVMLEVEEGSRE